MLEDFGYYLVWPGRGAMPDKARAFRDWLPESGADWAGRSEDRGGSAAGMPRTRYRGRDASDEMRRIYSAADRAAALRASSATPKLVASE